VNLSGVGEKTERKLKKIGILKAEVQIPAHLTTHSAKS
jgi:hypothetical protein